MNKYHAKKTNGFDSKREANRAAELQMMEKAKLISDLRFQVPYEIIPKIGKNRPSCFIADFVYVAEGQTVIEDCKGFRTPVYQLKKKLMRHVHGIEIKET